MADQKQPDLWLSVEGWSATHVASLRTLLRFLASFTEDADGCWLWTRTTNRKGYGQFRSSGRTVRAHRVAYELFVGPLEGSLHIDHLCRRRACVNPMHLEAVTPTENTWRALAVRRTNPSEVSQLQAAEVAYEERATGSWGTVTVQARLLPSGNYAIGAIVGGHFVALDRQAQWQHHSPEAIRGRAAHRVRRIVANIQSGGSLVRRRKPTAVS